MAFQKTSTNTGTDYGDARRRNIPADLVARAPISKPEVDDKKLTKVRIVFP